MEREHVCLYILYHCYKGKFSCKATFFGDSNSQISVALLGSGHNFYPVINNQYIVLLLIIVNGFNTRNPYDLTVVFLDKILKRFVFLFCCPYRKKFQDFSHEIYSGTKFLGYHTIKLFFDNIICIFKITQSQIL